MTSPIADATECINHAPVAHRIACKVIQERERLMARNAESRNSKQSFSETCGGRSIREMMEEKLDLHVDDLKSGTLDEKETADAKGQGRGVAWCIALILNPYKPDVGDVMNDAMLRYDDRHGIG